MYCFSIRLKNSVDVLWFEMMDFGWIDFSLRKETKHQTTGEKKLNLLKQMIWTKENNL